MQRETAMLVRRMVPVVGLGALTLGILGVFHAPAGYPLRKYAIGLIIAGAILLLAYVLRHFDEARAQRRAAEAAAPTAPGDAPPATPWLDNEQWAGREIVYDTYVSSVSTPFLVVSYLVGLALIPGIFAAVRATLREPHADVWGISFVGILFLLITIGILAFITRRWLRDRRYGASVCRLITLPGVVGGWLKADVDCALPAGSGPVSVRLENGEMSYNLKVVPRTFWRMEETTTTVGHPADARRSIIRVRLRVPRDP